MTPPAEVLQMYPNAHVIQIKGDVVAIHNGTFFLTNRDDFRILGAGHSVEQAWEMARERVIAAEFVKALTT